MRSSLTVRMLRISLVLTLATVAASTKGQPQAPSPGRNEAASDKPSASSQDDSSEQLLAWESLGCPQDGTARVRIGDTEFSYKLSIKGMQSDGSDEVETVAYAKRKGDHIAWNAPEGLVLTDDTGQSHAFRMTMAGFSVAKSGYIVFDDAGAFWSVVSPADNEPHRVEFKSVVFKTTSTLYLKQGSVIHSAAPIGVCSTDTLQGYATVNEKGLLVVADKSRQN